MNRVAVSNVKDLLTVKVHEYQKCEQMAKEDGMSEKYIEMYHDMAYLCADLLKYLSEQIEQTAAESAAPSMTSTRHEKIAVGTPLGRLEACIGGDPCDYPVIFTYLVRPDGVEIDLVACEVKVEEEVAQAYLYGDTETDQWTRSHQWDKDAINIECN